MRLFPILVSLACLPLVVSCNRAMLRIPTGASFPRTLAGYAAAHPTPLQLSIGEPRDLRAMHDGEPIAGTRWKACKTDALEAGEASQVVADGLVQELRFSRLFTDVERNVSRDLHLEAEIHALCAQAIGFLYMRVAGLTAIQFRLQRAGEVLYERKIERVVTDADPEYTGKQVATIEGAMLRVMADSLREVLHAFVADLDARQEAWAPALASP